MNHKRIRSLAIGLLGFLMLTPAVRADVRLPAVISDFMVLQQGIPLPIWGWANPGERVRITLGRQVQSTVADADGRWSVRFRPLRASFEPLEMVVQGQNRIVVKDILVGEVWLCSGQSNMEMRFSACENHEQEDTEFEFIRLCTVPRVPALSPQDNVRVKWTPCSRVSVQGFSGVGFFFGRHLFQQLNVPIGLINSSYGGTAAEPWTSRGAVENLPCYRGQAKPKVPTEEDQKEARAKYEKEWAAWRKTAFHQDKDNRGLEMGWARPDFDDSAWPEMTVPQAWQDAGIASNGVIWFRKTVEVPREWVGRKLVLKMGQIDDFDTTYFNGEQVGQQKDHLEAFKILRRYEVPGSQVQAGPGVIAVRVFDHVGKGGLVGPEIEMSLAPADEPRAAISLTGSWKYQVERALPFREFTPAPVVPAALAHQRVPSALFNGMIAPLIPFGIRGVIWYQGESNAHQAYRYRALFPALIADWRSQWAQGTFPFLFVQLASWKAPQARPGESALAELREAQFMTLRVPKTGMAVTIDIGDADDIHPRNKKDVGVRLGRAAERIAYGKKTLPSGPLYRSMKVRKGAVHLSFDFTGSGLVAKGESLTGFAVAGEDRQFVWADAIIKGRKVIVSSPEVPNPVAVRYGWADNPDCNLYNREGLPASPFRTDDWPGRTQPTQ